MRSEKILHSIEELLIDVERSSGYATRNESTSSAAFIGDRDPATPCPPAALETLPISIPIEVEPGARAA